MEISQGDQKDRFKDHIEIRNIRIDEPHKNLERLVIALKKKIDFKKTKLMIEVNDSAYFRYHEHTEIPPVPFELVGIILRNINELFGSENFNIEEDNEVERLVLLINNTKEEIIVMCEEDLKGLFLRLMNNVKAAVLKQYVYLITFKLA